MKTLAIIIAAASIAITAPPRPSQHDAEQTVIICRDMWTHGERDIKVVGLEPKGWRVEWTAVLQGGKKPVRRHCWIGEDKSILK